MSIRRIVAISMFCLAIGGANVSGEELQLQGHVVAVDKITPIIDKADKVYHVQRTAKPPVVDGKGDEWKDVPVMFLGVQEDAAIQPTPAATAWWGGPRDVSGSLRLLWDEQALYFCLQVTDDVHYAPNAGKGFWENDSFQFTLDGYMNGPKGGYDAEELNFCVCDSPAGPVMAHYRIRGDGKENEGLVTGQAVKMSVRDDGVRVYEWAMPWERIEPVSPWVLGRSGFSFALNDNDGKGYKGGLAWTKGILWRQDASQFGQIVFDGAAGARPGMLPLPPEVKLRAGQTQSYWLDIGDASPFEMARLLVFPVQAGRVRAEVAIYRKGEQVPAATGRIEHVAVAKQAIVFVWNLGPLPNGQYEVTYRTSAVPAGPSPRQAFTQFGLSQLRQTLAKLRDRFGSDRPWDDLAGAPALVRRHRGLVTAAAKDLLEAGPWAETLAGLNIAEFERAVADATAMMEDLAAGKDFLGRQRGVFWSAYYSPADGSGQPFVTGIPEDYDPAKAYPLLVNLHGRTGRPTLLAGDRSTPGVLWVTPWGRGDQSFRSLGEDDVLRVIAYMKEWYNVDPDRVYVTGGSMGGGGTWWMASRHPDLFAAASVLCGYSSGIPFENLRHVPMFVQQGVVDPICAIDQARQAVDALRQMGYAVTYREYPNVGHAVPDGIGSVPHMLKLRRPVRPDSVSYTCETADMGQAYWLAIRRLVDPHQRARVDARVTGPATYQVLSLREANVEVLELYTRQMPLDPDAALHVQVARKELTQAAPIPERLFLVRNAEAWTLTNRWEAPASTVRAYRTGAAANLYRGEPLLIVYGTSGAGHRTEWLRAAATNLVRFGGRSRDPLTPGRFPVKADRDVTADDLQRFNMVLLGGPKDNQLVARMADKFPFQINDRGELIADGREPVSLKGAAVRFHYYNPMAPQRLVYLVWTDEDTESAKAWWTRAGEYMQVTGDMDLTGQPDLAVQALRSLDEAALTNADSRVNGPYRRLMQFTYDWKWRELAGADVRLSPEMAKSRVFAQADLRLLRRHTAADVAIGWNPKEDDVEYDSQWITRADVATRIATPGQTLLCTVSGKDLFELYQGRVAKGELAMDSALPPQKMNPSKEYRVVMSVDLTWDLWKVEGRLHNIESGPDWNPAICWQEVFETLPRASEAPGKAK